PEAQTVRIDPESQELVVGGRERGSRGKGTRSVLHAAFTVGLGEYCFDREIEHPGFIVLDSPLVTYRSPDSSESEIRLPRSVADLLYGDLDTRRDGQFIIMENVEPSEALRETLHIVRFTKQKDVGRYGLFPARTKNTRRVAPSKIGEWIVTLYADPKVIAEAETQDEAISTARRMLEDEGGGDILVYAGDGSFHSIKAVEPGTGI
ncbi:DUF2188 domain-containing protein, partial [Glutamicibacter sp.]|uniref:DUF2188 domain-containing protein n=1 Tax=Glutamicibacter sp. TaxID=1931995 RepID=UPI002FD9F7B3